jgi:hypothetical protein
MTHPDKGTEMFLYELGYMSRSADAASTRALVSALASLARERGCYGMWVLADTGNAAAPAVYTGPAGQQSRAR